MYCRHFIILVELVFKYHVVESEGNATFKKVSIPYLAFFNSEYVIDSKITNRLDFEDNVYTTYTYTSSW